LLLIPLLSPELMHFGQRDFSIYALDPSESDSAPTSVVVSSGSGSSSQPTSAPQQPPGVAVGMGLMSWALAAPDDSVFVTGIMNKTASGDSALEVVFALRGVLSFVFDVSLMSDCMHLDGTCSAASRLSAWCSRRKPLAASDANARAYAHATRYVRDLVIFSLQVYLHVQQQHIQST
jgi:hypothetical protein